MLHLTPNVLIVIAAVFAALLVATAFRVVVFYPRRSEEVARNRLRSLGTWWVLAVLFVAALWVGPWGVAALIAIASALGMHEYLSLVAPRAAGRRMVPFAYLTIVLQAVFAAARWRPAFVAAVPAGMLAILAAAGVVFLVGAKGRRLTTYLRDAANLYWGAIVLVYLPSHAAWLAGEPESSNPAGGGSGWLLYLVMLTELNDIAQALIGRKMGRRRITPVISPHKTWEGFLGGLATTVVLAVVLAPWLTPFFDADRVRGFERMPFLWAAGAGLLIAVVGFLGDIDISVLKRARGVKDSGTLLPGQGGILDRIDSLTLSAPCFLYYVEWVCR